jgi:cysteine-rich repeat protein
VQGAVTCPASVCGNAIVEPGEECDDGNRYDGDTCHNDCRKNNCQLFPSTFDLIQQAIFEQHGCTAALCHGSAAQGGLDLRRGAAYTNLVDTPSMASGLKRVEPGDEERSLLWLKLAAATLQRQGVPGQPMPQGLPPLTEGELEALRLWIYSGAPQSGVVRGTADLLKACLPPPEPLQIRPPAPPARGTGVQLHMPRWVLEPTSESEVCFATYYDVSEQVPEEFRSPDGKSFRYNVELTTQDPLSHHLIANLYAGVFSPDDPSWGSYLCVGGNHDGEVCNPLAKDACGEQGECATPPVRSVACIGQGPPDNQLNISSFGFTGTQKAVTFNTYPDGVYAELPLKGVILWNSHAFNLADQPAKLEAWLNFTFAPRAAQQHALVPLVNTDQVFAMHAPAFGTDEVCNVQIFPAGAQLFEISSHMHKRGKRFRIFRGAFKCNGGTKSGRACSPLSPELCPNGTCVESTGRDANASLMYTSLIYNDPVVLRFTPPLAMEAAVAERSFTYCALYDNGAADPSTVKRKSTSAIPPLMLGFGGPCATPTHCVAGNVRQACSGRNQAQLNASCDSSPGAGDGFCDACPLGGGVTTDDEMFVLTGSYFMQ